MQDTLVSSMSMDGVPELSKTDIGTTRPSPRPLRGLVLVQLCGFFAYAPQTANHQQGGLLAWSALDWKVKASSPLRHHGRRLGRKSHLSRRSEARYQLIPGGPPKPTVVTLGERR